MRRLIIALMALSGAAHAAYQPPAGSDLSQGNVTANGPTTSGSLTQTMTIIAGNAPVAGNQTPVAASAMKIDLLSQNSPDYNMAAEASIWPTQTYTYFGVSKEFTATTLPATGAGSPSAGIFALANNKGSDADVTAIIGDAVVRKNSGVVFGSNFIARSGGGSLTGVKLVGQELDIEPAAGDTVASGGGLFINAFNVAMPIPAIQIGGLGGGTFSNGIIVNAVVGSALAAQTSSSTMASLINTSNGTYSDQAIVLGNTHRIRFTGTGGFSATNYVDNSGNWRFVPPGNGGLFFRTGNDAANIFQVSSSGQVIAGAGSALATTATNFQMLIPFVAGTPTGVPANNAGGVAFQYDTTSQRPWFYDNSSFAWVAGATEVSGVTSSIGGSSLAAGACTSGTLSLAGATTGKVVVVTPETYPGDGIVWHGYISSSNTVTVKVCSILAATPTASLYDVRVIQ